MRVKSYELRVKSYGSGGFTLTELLIAIGITALVTAAVYASFITQQRSFIVQDQAAETLVSSRIAFDMIANDIRTAGFGYPADEEPKPKINGFEGAIIITDAAGPNNSDKITLLGGFRKIAELEYAVVTGSNQIDIKNYTSTKFNLTNKRWLSIDGIQFAKIESCTLIGDPPYCSPAFPLTLDRAVNISFPAGRPVYLVEDVTYQIEDGNLKRVIAGGGSGNVETVANNIEDLQFAYGVDTDNDGVVDNKHRNGKDDLRPTDKVITIRAGLLARTAKEDPTLEPSTKPYYLTGITLERNTTPDNDRFRRRVWSMEIALRNPR